METIRVRKLDHSNLHVDCDSGIAQELNEFFSFFVPGYRFMPAYKNKVWDGKIRLYSRATGELPAGLYHHLVQFARSRGYDDQRFCRPKRHGVYTPLSADTRKSTDRSAAAFGNRVLWAKSEKTFSAAKLPRASRRICV